MIPRFLPKLEIPFHKFNESWSTADMSIFCEYLMIIQISNRHVCV